VKAIHQPARQAKRHRRRGGRWLLVASACVVALLTAALITVLLPDHKANAGYAAATPAASTYASVPRGAGALTAAPSVTAAASRSASAAPVTPPTSSSPRTSAATPAAGRIRPGATYVGVATEYSAGNGDGACLFGPAADMMIAAMNYTDYESSRACGAYVQVRAANGASITVLITNECPLPCAPGQIDLSQQAFAKLADPTLGRIPITWTLTSPGLSNTVSIRYKTGSSQYWCGIQVIGHRNPVTMLEVRAGSGWRPLPRTDYNYFLSADGGGCGGPIRLTDIYGQQLTVNGIALQPNVAQQSVVQFAEH
jgi:expansin (peptidoglycan-binding protein)